MFPKPDVIVTLFSARLYSHRSPLRWHLPGTTRRFALLLVFALFSLTVREGRAQPLLSIDGPTLINIGTLFEGQTTLRRLTLFNKGNRTLRIGRLWTSCGCTAAALPSADILPGTGETLSVSFDTRDLQGDFRREVHIASNDSSKPRFDISFQGTIVPVVMITPRYVSFGRMRLRHREHKTVQIVNTIKDTIRIGSCSSPEPQMSLALSTNVLPPDSSSQLSIDVLPVRMGKILGQIVMATDTKLKPVIKISFAGTAR